MAAPPARARAHLARDRKELVSIKISRHCYAITGLGFLPPWSVNAGFIAGEVVTLVVDTGATTQAARTIYGYASSARSNNRVLAINTERHLDHIGGNSLFRDLGCDIYGHPQIARVEDELDFSLDRQKNIRYAKYA
jgi:glyoxylase-like metal-dependent hydrolase (beta-lactamase superfamily II)